VAKTQLKERPCGDYYWQARPRKQYYWKASNDPMNEIIELLKADNDNIIIINDIIELMNDINDNDTKCVYYW